MAYDEDAWLEALYEERFEFNGPYDEEIEVDYSDEELYDPEDFDTELSAEDKDYEIEYFSPHNQPSHSH